MSERDLDGIVRLPPPSGCALWNEPARAAVPFAATFEAVEHYVDESHLTRSLFRCRECGQLYFHEWYEWVDWDDGDDKHYSTMIPVQTHEQAAQLKDADVFTLLGYFPRLQWDHGMPEWIGKE
jgi:hypothetical protein